MSTRQRTHSSVSPPPETSSPPSKRARTYYTSNGRLIQTKPPLSETMQTTRHGSSKATHMRSGSASSSRGRGMSGRGHGDGRGRGRGVGGRGRGRYGGGRGGKDGGKKGGARGSDDNEGEGRKPGRAEIACLRCRRRKIRCDQGIPCTECVLRDAVSSCVYLSVTEENAASREREAQPLDGDESDEEEDEEMSDEGDEDKFPLAEQSGFSAKQKGKQRALPESPSSSRSSSPDTTSPVSIPRPSAHMAPSTMPLTVITSGPSIKRPSPPLPPASLLILGQPSTSPLSIPSVGTSPHFVLSPLASPHTAQFTSPLSRSLSITSIDHNLAGFCIGEPVNGAASNASSSTVVAARASQGRSPSADDHRLSWSSASLNFVAQTLQMSKYSEDVSWRGVEWVVDDPVQPPGLELKDEDEAYRMGTLDPSSSQGTEAAVRCFVWASKGEAMGHVKEGEQRDAQGEGDA